MQKTVLVAFALLTASVSFAQQKKHKQPPPPPPPPVVKLDKLAAPPPPPHKPPPPPKVTREHLPSPSNADYQAFLKANPTVKSIGWSEDKVRIHLKSGKDEVYHLNNEADMLTLKNTYGELPAPPPPPPPPKVVKVKKAS
ncbi:MAG: hypothetical protein ACTHMD_11435 [Flavisolibacter sp.]